MPALSAKNVLNVEKTRLRAFFACRLGLELFARPHNDPVIRISSKFSDSDILGLLPQAAEILDRVRKYLLCRAGEFAAFQFDVTAVSNLFERLKAGRKVQ